MNTPVRRRPGPRPSGSDQGSAEPLFILPLVFVMLLGVVQTGLWAHAQHRAQAIASQALAAARAYDGSMATAYEQAGQAREQLGGGMLRQMEVDVRRGADQARVRVEARTVSLLPGVALPVVSEVSGPVERLAP
ncbi:TadE/TadG family type IV pilus assembly protein [Nocardiopsis dassonvillei]|uniref:TadE/TadG family type IV pilus assembly protein n=1 Tax=Nocardiopsis dassonvillei TaxID=2014 RepID=UPI003633F8BD